MAWRVKCDVCSEKKEIGEIKMKGMRIGKLVGIILIILAQGVFSKQIKDANKDGDIDAKK